MKLLPLLLLLSGCQTCREHPVVCGVAAGVVTYSLTQGLARDKTAKSIQHHDTTQPITNGSIQ